MKRPLQSKKKLDYLNAKPFLSVNEACQLIGIGRTNFYSMLSSKRIKVVNLGRRTLVTRKAIDDLFTVSPRKRKTAKRKPSPKRKRNNQSKKRK